MTSEVLNSTDSDENTFQTVTINKSGFPINKHTWESIWINASEHFPYAKNKIEEIRNKKDLKKVPLPHVPLLHFHTSSLDCIKLVQNYISSLTYNFIGLQLFDIKKSRPLAGLMDTAKEIVKESLPIKCLEAVILGLYLTSSLTNVSRFPIGFKSTHKGRSYYHIVLGLSFAGCYGSIGISRKSNLMDKPLRFKSLSSLLEDFSKSYAQHDHKLRKIRIGGQVSHDIHSMEKVKWQLLTVNYNSSDIHEMQNKINRFSRQLRSCSTPDLFQKTKKLSSDNKRSFKKRVKRKIGVEVKSKVKSSKP